MIHVARLKASFHVMNESDGVSACVMSQLIGLVGEWTKCSMCHTCLSHVARTNRNEPRHR